MTQLPRDYCALVINGTRHEIRGCDVFMMLADYLRYKLNLHGTKIVCAEGDCGACTVLWYRENAKKSARFVPINACIATLAQLDGCHLITVEALQEQGSLSAVQKAMVAHHGSQCGFCTPGFIMALTALFQQKKLINEQNIKNALTGNLCRCTGYKPIIDAALSVDQNKIAPLDFTAEKHKLAHDCSKPFHIKHENIDVAAPCTLHDALSLKDHDPSLMILSGATDIGVMYNQGRVTHKKYLSLHLIDELYDIYEQDGRMVIGARVTLADARRFIKNLVPEFADFLNIFASPQIKNIASVVGNIANASPIGDTLPFFLVSDGMIFLQSMAQKRTIPMNDFFIGYKKTALLPREIITHISFAIPKSSTKLRLYKSSIRKDLDISSVNAAFSLQLGGDIVTDAHIAVGGCDIYAKRLKNIENYLVKKSLSKTVIKEASRLICAEISPISDLRGHASHRQKLAQGMWQKYCNEIL